MRIAWVTYDFEEYSTAHVNAMAADHDVLLVMPRAEEDQPTCATHAAVQRYSFDKPRLRQPLRQYKSVKSIVDIIDDFNPDVVHFQQGHLWFNWALFKLRKKYPLVITIHDPRHHAGDTVSQKTPQWVMDMGFRQADHAIVHGNALVAEVNQLFKIPTANIHTVPHIAMGRDENQVITAVETDPNLILFFGRIYQYKGLEYLIRAQPLISNRVPDARIMIAGQGENFDHYETLIHSGDRDPARFIIRNDWITDSQRTEMFEQAAIVVLPYTEATQSGVVPVAHNFSKPVVATDVGALSECVIDQQDGLLIPPRDPAALADAIVKLLQNKSLRESLGENGKQKLDRECSPDVVAKKTVDVYRAAAGLPAAALVVVADSADPQRQPVGGRS